MNDDVRIRDAAHGLLLVQRAAERDPATARVLAVSACTGLRIGDLAALTAANVDGRRMTLDPHALDPDGRSSRLKCGNGSLPLPIAALTAPLFAAIIADAETAGRASLADSRGVSRLWSKVRQGLGPEAVPTPAFRRFFADTARDAGHLPEAINRALWRSSYSPAAEIYRWRHGEALRQLFEDMAARLASIAEAAIKAGSG